nr:hypothetical protein [Tanacetum cinerariifolium]
MTMETTIEQQVALDEALIPSTQRLRIGRSNFRLPSDIQFKESTLQVVYDVLRIYPLFKAFLVTADVPEIYMQEFEEISWNSSDDEDADAQEKERDDDEGNQKDKSDDGEEDDDDDKDG